MVFFSELFFFERLFSAYGTFNFIRLADFRVTVSSVDNLLICSVFDLQSFKLRFLRTIFSTCSSFCISPLGRPLSNDCFLFRKNNGGSFQVAGYFSTLFVLLFRSNDKSSFCTMFTTAVFPVTQPSWRHQIPCAVRPAGRHRCPAPFWNSRHGIPSPTHHIPVPTRWPSLPSPPPPATALICCEVTRVHSANPVIEL